MITYIGIFCEDEIVRAAREYIEAYSSRGNIDEISIPFCEHGSTLTNYVQFALLAGVWVFVGIK